MNRAGTRKLASTASVKEPMLEQQTLIKQHSSSVKDIEIQSTKIDAAERWMSFPPDKSIVCKYI